MEAELDVSMGYDRNNKGEIDTISYRITIFNKIETKKTMFSLKLTKT